MLKRIASNFSLWLVLVSVANAVDDAQLKVELAQAHTPEQVRHALDLASQGSDTKIADEAVKLLNQGEHPSEPELRKLQDEIDLRARVQTAASPGQDVAAQVKAIKSSPLFRDSGTQEESNWLARALKNLHFDLDLPAAKPRPKQASANPSAVLEVLKYLVIGALVALVILFIVLAVRHFEWQKRLRKKSGAVLDEEEPMRTLDEWLALADKLTAEGRYREAVRCLYLACLLRFDEHGVARFERSQTNWEHLARIQASPKRLSTIEFLAPTQAFDRIWYGKRVRGIEDVDQFTLWYKDLTRVLSEGVAAS